MKIRPKCFECEMKGAYEQARKSTEDEEVQYEALRAFSEFLANEVSMDSVPAEIGINRNRIIREIASEPDPYRYTKEEMNETGEEIAPLASELVESGKDNREVLRGAIKVVAVGNSFDFSPSEHDFDLKTFKEKFQEVYEGGFDLDESDEAISRILSSESVLYLLDNSGEAILDKILMGKIRETGADLYIGARSIPIQDDITAEMAEEMGFGDFGEVLPAGESTGVYPEAAPRGLREKLDTVDLVISKGQGNYETLSEDEADLEGRLVYLMMAKCGPVADSLGVARGSIICKAV